MILSLASHSRLLCKGRVFELNWGLSKEALAEAKSQEEA